MLDYNVPGGKLNRGLSVIDSYKLLKEGEELTDDEVFLASALGWCIEWLQAYFLVLDDIMDNSHTSRGQPCWFRVPKVGMIAVSDGIILRNQIPRILRKHFRDKKYYVDLLDLFNEAWKNGGQQQFYQRRTNQPNQAASGFTRSCNDFDKGTTAPNTSYGQKFEATDNKSYGMKSGSSCFKCGQEGHRAKDCPTTTSNVATGAIENQKFEATDNRSYGMKCGSSCFKCGLEGHWAKDCPTITSNVAAGAIGNQSTDSWFAREAATN